MESVMSIINHIISGAVRSVKSIKAVLTIWIATLFLVCLVALPMKSSINSVIGNSMITEKLSDGINFDVLADFGNQLPLILAAITKGFFLLVFFGILMNVFFNGGLFTTLRNSEEKYSTAQFFRGAGISFWSFLLITVIMTLIIFVVGLVIFYLSFHLMKTSQLPSDVVKYRAFITGSIISALVLPVFLNVVDYARVWQASSPRSAGFKAIGVGFKQAFRYFFSSYFVMFAAVLGQAIFAWFAMKLISGMGPQKAGGIFLLFLLSQFLFIIRLLLRVWRYVSVTSMYERHPEK
jgi:hypothetical protein